MPHQSVLGVSGSLNPLPHSDSPSQLCHGPIPHLNESIQISFANEDFNGHRLTSETERGDGKVVTEMKCVAKWLPTAIHLPTRVAEPWEAGTGLPHFGALKVAAHHCPEETQHLGAQVPSFLGVRCAHLPS